MQQAPFYQFLHKREPVCYYQMAALAVQFPYFLKLFVFCQSEAHFASPWQTQVYFLLGLNTCGSQMRETAPRESSGSHQLVDEVVLCFSSQVLEGLCVLNWRSKSTEEGKGRKELKVHPMEEYFLILLSALLLQAELVVSTSCVPLTSYCVGGGTCQVSRAPTVQRELPEAGPTQCASPYCWHVARGLAVRSRKIYSLPTLC